MKNLAFVLMISMLFAFDSSKKDKWVTIFNGKDLDGWTMKIAGQTLGENYGNTFRVENGILSIRYDNDVYKNFNNQFGALYYKKKLTNYRLKVEYRFVGETAVGAPVWGFRDSGVQYHSQSPESLELNQQFPTCLEYNLHGGNGKEDRPTGELCANGMIVQINGQPNPSFCNLPTVQRTFHGDQWVTLEIDVKGDRITHFVNGEEILKFEDPRLKTTNEKVTSGYVSLQSNSHPIDFRKIELLEY